MRYKIKDHVQYGDELTLQTIEDIQNAPKDDIGKTYTGDFDGTSIFICEMPRGMVAIQVGNDFATIDRMELHDFVSRRV